MPEIKLDTKVRKAVAEALEVWSRTMFDQQNGEWTAVITFGHAARTEEVKTEDDFEYLAQSVKLRILDAEIVTGPAKDKAEEARMAARTQRTTAGTLLEEAFE
jgi:hypothetical protein